MIEPFRGDPDLPLWLRWFMAIAVTYSVLVVVVFVVVGLYEWIT